MRIIKQSKHHLDKNNMSYLQHFKFAAGHGIRCMKAGLLLLIHSLIPALFPKTGSTLVHRLNQSFTDHNDWIDLKTKMKNFENIYRS